MKNLDKIAEELFNKIRGRYPSITLGDKESTITNMPGTARFFDFDFREGVKVNVTLDENSITILYNNDLIEESPDTVKSMWFDFMKEMRTFAKKRMLNFDTRDITKSNLDKRDYQYLSQNRPGEEQMSESKMYGTSKTSFQDIGNAKMIVKHRGPVDFENPAGRTQQIDSIYIESAEGERFKYPFRHLNGARAMCTHVSEGGNQYDAFGKHIVSLSEELSKLRTFKTYMNRSAVMAEGLAGYMDIVNERIETIKETVFKLQRPTHYKEAFESFEETVLEEVPEDVSSNWIDELTIRQFNEDLKSVFPYIYNLVKENTKAKQVGPDDLLGETEEEVAVEQNDDTENYSMEDEYASHLDNVVANSKHEQGPVQEGESVEDFMTKIANSDDGYELMDQGLRGKHGPEIEKALMDMYNEVSTDHGYHPDDDFEEIHDRMMSEIEDDYGTNEGNEFAQKVRELKAKGAKPGTKFKTSDGEEHTLEDAIRLAGLQVEDFWSAEELMAEKGADDDTMDVKIDKDGAISKADAPDELHDKEEEELPLDEFIKGHFDYTTNQFPKGETAVMTAVEKKYGDEAIRDATEIMQELVTGQDEEMSRIKTLAGLEH